MKTTIGFLAILMSVTAFAQSHQPQVKRLGSGEVFSFTPASTEANKYQLGDEWGKKPVSFKDTKENSPLAKIIKGTASLGGATAFYLGKYNGQFVMATNYHVCPRASACERQRIEFPVLRMRAKVEKVLGSWSDVDLSLLTIRVDDNDEEALSAVANPFDFKSHLRPGDLLATAGFGIAENPSQKLMVNADNDCKVFSDEDEFKFMADPDEVNPGKYKAWSFANGCDVSHGDSGSAFVNRKTGRVIGLVWTGRIPKAERVQSSDYLTNMLSTHSEEIWTELTYAVPAQKIYEFLDNKVSSGDLDEETQPIIEEILKQQ